MSITKATVALMMIAFVAACARTEPAPEPAPVVIAPEPVFTGKL